MHPDLEDFLEETFADIPATANTIGRVVVEPDYNVAPHQEDRQKLVHELNDCLRNQTAPIEVPAAGLEVPIAAKYSVLKKYVRRISFYPDAADGSWIEVSPPGNWI